MCYDENMFDCICCFTLNSINYSSGISKIEFMEKSWLVICSQSYPKNMDVQRLVTRAVPVFQFYLQLSYLGLQ